MLSPASLVTGLTGHVVGKVRDHVLTYTKATPVASTEAEHLEDCETTTKAVAVVSITTKRPTLIDFIDKFKTKRSIQSGESADCGCSGKVSIADGIGEHLVDKVDATSAELEIGHADELDEVLSHREKRSNVDSIENSKESQSSKSGCSASAFCSAINIKRPTCSATKTGTCDRIET